MTFTPSRRILPPAYPEQTGHVPNPRGDSASPAAGAGLPAPRVPVSVEPRSATRGTPGRSTAGTGGRALLRRPGRDLHDHDQRRANGPLVVASGTTCLVNGAVTVRTGAALSVTNSTINGAMTATNAASITYCGASENGALKITGTIGTSPLAGRSPTAYLRRRRDPRRGHDPGPRSQSAPTGSADRCPAPATRPPPATTAPSTPSPAPRAAGAPPWQFAD
jgi:hypothetical protein